MKPDYKNWVPESLLEGPVCRNRPDLYPVPAVRCNGADPAWNSAAYLCRYSRHRNDCSALFYRMDDGIYRTFDYKGKRKLAKTIVERTAGVCKDPRRRHRSGCRLWKRCAGHRLRKEESKSAHGRLRYLERRIQNRVYQGAL